MNRVPAATLVAASMLLAGCAGPSSLNGPDPTIGPGNLVLYVSNQSFEDDPVGIRVEIGDRTVVDDMFRVEDQHNWIEYRLNLPAGLHLLQATSGTGATISHDLELPEDETRWVVVAYWYDPDDLPLSLTVDVRDAPVGFE